MSCLEKENLTLMNKVNTESVSFEIRSIENVYLFNGEIDLRRDTEIAKILNEAVDPDFRMFDLEEMDGDSVSSSDILSAVTTIPMGSGRKVVIVDKVERMPADDQSKLASILPRLNNNSCLILLCSDNSKPKRSQKTGKKTSPNDEGDKELVQADTTGKGLSAELVKAVKSSGTIVTYTKMKTAEVKPIIQEVVKSFGKTINPSALDALTWSLEANPSMIEKEVEKLAAYLGDRENIVEADVNELIEKPDEDKVFPLIDAIASAQPASAAKLLNETFAASMKPDQDVLKLLSLMSRHFRMLYQTKYLLTEAKSSGNSIEDAAQNLMSEQSPLSMRDWQLNKLNAQARRFSKKEIEWCLKQILECELAVKGIGKTGGTPRLNLEALIFKLSLRRQPN